MYAQFFGLRQEPFSIAPDPRYLFMSERHREALAHLLYGLRGGGGFVLLTGEIGAGKTTVCRCFLEQIPKRCNYAYIFNPKLTVQELLVSICEEFHVPYEHEGPGLPTVKDYVDALNDFLLKMHAVGQSNVLVIDEAQNLSADVLEQLRLLTNLETNERKLLQIILIGQPELRTMLARPELEQLAQRVIARYHLDALSEAETVQYVRHRLAVAGRTGPLPFDREARPRIHELSRGVPRRINLLCDRALLGAYAEGKSRVDRATVDKAASEVFDEEKSVPLYARLPRTAVLALGVVAGAALVGVATLAMHSTGGAGAADPSAAGKAAAASSATAAATPASAVKSAAGALAPASAPGSVPASPSLAQPSAAPPASASSSPASKASPKAPAAATAAGTVAATATPAAATASAIAPGPPAAAPADAKAAFKSPLRDEKDAWRELAQSWKLTLDASDPCQAAQRQQVHCFKGNSSLAFLRRLARPVILTLNGDADRDGYAVLTGLTAQSATLRAGGESHTVPLATLEKMWQGEFATFWRAPPGYVNTIVEGQSGPVANWLAVQLAKLHGEPPPADNKQAVDAALRSKVQSFQVAQGLKPDGLAGPITLMQLNRATGVDEPRLHTER